ncbi:SGNH/GDSL hydrolase family protein [Cognatitamlana onchidii]|uniref:SGNH/GDSL hydrolase family protein n=1 Tax=Cognatitamlana onchidii TaxID=2562860 RepID=UPI0010A690D3|nr:SGNH/GDSL hydrolase family protein [Algibacter onchidii]
MKKSLSLWLFVALISLNCNTDSPDNFIGTTDKQSEEVTPQEEGNAGEETSENQDENQDSGNPLNNQNKSLKILSLGDSYTIGERVCETCRFPEQLKRELSEKFNQGNIDLQIIARTGWTTSSLIGAITSEKPRNDFDLVTLLIGVNNQFQGRPFSLYEDEFVKLVNTAVRLANGKKDRVIVVSIPDYAFTPFGRGNVNISKGIDTYNTFAENYCKSIDISYVYITDITREGLNNTALVASDGLHPSELAYSKFVERILPLALNKLSP